MSALDDRKHSEFCDFCCTCGLDENTDLIIENNRLKEAVEQAELLIACRVLYPNRFTVEDYNAWLSKYGKDTK